MGCGFEVDPFVKLWWQKVPQGASFQGGGMFPTGVGTFPQCCVCGACALFSQQCDRLLLV